MCASNWPLQPRCDASPVSKSVPRLMWSASISLLFFIQGLLDYPGRILHSKQRGKPKQTGVASNLKVLHLTARHHQSSIPHRRSSKTVEDFVDLCFHLLQNCIGPALRFPVDLFEDLLCAYHMFPSLRQVVFKAGPELRTAARLSHLGENPTELLLGIVHRFETS